MIFTDLESAWQKSSVLGRAAHAFSEPQEFLSHAVLLLASLAGLEEGYPVSGLGSSVDWHSSYEPSAKTIAHACAFSLIPFMSVPRLAVALEHTLGVEEATDSKPRPWLPLMAMAEGPSSLHPSSGNSGSPSTSDHITLIPTLWAHGALGSLPCPLLNNGLRVYLDHARWSCITILNFIHRPIF